MHVDPLTVRAVATALAPIDETLEHAPNSLSAKWLVAAATVFATAAVVFVSGVAVVISLI